MTTLRKPVELLVLGSTGSIGTQTLELVRKNPNLRVKGLSANSNVALLLRQIEEFKPEFVAVSDNGAAASIAKELPRSTEIFSGETALSQLVKACSVDVVVVAVLGFAALQPVVEALRIGAKLALANKESLVAAGDLIRPLLKQFRGRIVPVDSEHSAIYQLLKNKSSKEVSKIILTASGGPFLKRPIESFHTITPEEAVKHPTWNMGAKISVDSATLMNKGLEVIEAAQLFELPAEKIGVLIHPESLIHGLVEERSGSLNSCAFTTDMKLPIAYAIEELSEEGLEIQNMVSSLDLGKWGKLHFENPDPARFPALELAYQALRQGGSAPLVLNGADEVAVSKFLSGEIRFTDIVMVVDKVLSAHSRVQLDSVEQVYELDAESRRKALEVIKEIR